MQTNLCLFSTVEKSLAVEIPKVAHQMVIVVHGLLYKVNRPFVFPFDLLQSETLAASNCTIIVALQMDRPFINSVSRVWKNFLDRISIIKFFKSEKLLKGIVLIHPEMNLCLFYLKAIFTAIFWSIGRVVDISVWKKCVLKAIFHVTSDTIKISLSEIHRKKGKFEKGDANVTSTSLSRRIHSNGSCCIWFSKARG